MLLKFRHKLVKLKYDVLRIYIVLIFFFSSSSGSPITFYADAIAPGHVTAYGPGLVTGVVNKPAEFTVVTKDAGAGTLYL